MLTTEFKDQYVYNVDVVRVIDGDTARLRLWKDFNLEIDFGFYIKEKITFAKSTEMNFRLYGINAPETRGVSEAEKSRGNASTKELERLLSLGKVIAKTHKPDKYGRWLIELWVTTESGQTIFVNDSLIETGHAVAYLQDS